VRRLDAHGKPAAPPERINFDLSGVGTPAPKSARDNRLNPYTNATASKRSP